MWTKTESKGEVDEEMKLLTKKFKSFFNKNTIARRSEGNNKEELNYCA